MTGAVGLLIAAALACLLAHAGTPLAIQAANRTGFVDRPGTPLKRHRDPIPYLGGMAVFVPFLTTAGLLFELDAAFLGVLLAASLAALLGLMDDFGAMRPGVKLAGQFVVVLVLLRAGVRIDLEALPVGLNLALTAFWMLSIMNAMNFLDIMDGLAASVALVAAVAFFGLALLTGAPHMAGLSAALLGALLGYLRFSLPPARIFLGDSGSLFLGAVLGSLALALDYSRVNNWAVAAPLLVLAVPCFEIAFTVIVRVCHGRPPWLGSPDHVALRLRRLGLTVPRVLLVTTAAGVLGGSFALWLVAGAQPGSPLAALAPWLLALAALLALAWAALLLRAPDPPR